MDGMEIVEAELAKLEADLFAVMPEQREAIVRLLDTRYDNLPTPVRRMEISSGFVHGRRWLTCPDCLANDQHIVKHRGFGCETCGGSGRIPDTGRDPMAKTETVAYGADGSRHDQTYARDRQIEALAEQLRPASEIDELADANEHGYGWEEARRAMYRRFDYEALDRALEQLQLARPGASPYTDASLAFIDFRMPVVIRAPGPEPEPEVAQGRVARAAGPIVLRKRDEEIRRAVLEAGIATSAVARTWGLSVSQVNRIVADAA